MIKWSRESAIQGSQVGRGAGTGVDQHVAAQLERPLPRPDPLLEPVQVATESTRLECALAGTAVGVRGEREEADCIEDVVTAAADDRD